MPERKKYVVDMHSMEIKDILVGNGTEYEIIATDDEVKQIEAQFIKMKDDSIHSLKNTLFPFNEKEVDKDRALYHSHLMTVFQITKDLGTEKTKKEIESLNVVN